MSTCATTRPRNLPATGSPSRFPSAANATSRITSGFEPYNGSDLEKKIAEALVKRFHGEGDDYEAYKGVADLDADSVGMEGTAKIWYIGRFLDGFIFDTNIDEVKQIIYGEVRKTGSAHSYDVQNPDLITAFYYIVPHLKYGQWATLVTTSTNAYGTTGKSGGVRVRRPPRTATRRAITIT